MLGLFVTDGSIYKRNRNKNAWTIKYNSKSYFLIKQIQHLLRRLGILCISNRVESNGFVLYELRIQNRYMIKRFIETVGFVGKKMEKAKRFLEISFLRQSNLLIDRLPIEVTKKIIKLKKEQHTTWKKLEYRCQIKDNYQRIDRNNLQKVAKKLDNIYLKKLANSDIAWLKIKEINYIGQRMTYDLVIPGIHNFIANDILVHNSGGIEQNSDGVWLIDRPAVHRGKGELSDTILYIGKNRHGVTGKLKLFYGVDRLQFRGT